MIYLFKYGHKFTSTQIMGALTMIMFDNFVKTIGQQHNKLDYLKPIGKKERVIVKRPRGRPRKDGTLKTVYIQPTYIEDEIDE